MSLTAPMSNKSLLSLACAAVSVAFVAGVVAHTTEGWVAPVVADVALLVTAGPVLVVLGRLATSSQVAIAARRSDQHVTNVASGIREHAEEQRAKQSRHEYAQEMALHRLELGMASIVASTHPRAHAQSERPRVLFITSNGGGLGHLTRLMAVAEHLDADARFLTLSTAYETARGRGHEVHYFPSADVAGVETPVWNRLFTGYLREFVAEHRPDLLVFDGTYVYTGVTQASRLSGVPLVWMQRGTWKEGVPTFQRHHAADVADAVIVPGDYGNDEWGSVGSNVKRFDVGPISLVRPEDLVPREQALAELELDPTKRHVLIQLGSGQLNDTVSLRQVAVDAVHALGPEWVPVVTRSPLSVDPDPEGAVAIVAYPVARHFNAFEAAVVAAGYNAVTECVSLHLPSVLVPNPAARTDDQTRRARGVAEAGLAEIAVDVEEIPGALRRVTGDGVAYRTRLAQAPRADGGVEAADCLSDLLETYATMTNLS